MIAVFDSGIGGISILREVRKRIPDVPLLYFGDTAYMPYGSLTREQIYDRVKWFIKTHDAHIDLYVIACNTATVALLGEYRKLTSKPFVGIEPGIKPAAAVSNTKQIAVLATPFTTHSEKMKQLIEQFGSGCTFHLIACEGLAEAIERAPEKIDARLQECIEKIPPEVDTVVLACTHYPLIQDRFAAALPGKTLIDVSPAIAAQAKRIYDSLSSHLPDSSNKIRVESSGDTNMFRERINAFL